METIKYQGMSVEKFTDIYEFLDIVNSRPLNRQVIQYKGCKTIAETSSHECSDIKYEKSGTSTWEEADRLFENGYEEGVKLIIDAGEKMKGFGGVQYKTDIVGCAPCIPNAIMGLPDSMIKVEKREQKAISLNIFYNNTASYSVSKNSLARCSRRLLDAIASLEARNIKIGLNLLPITTCDGYVTTEAYGAFIPLKKCDQPLNLKKISYPLVHTSFFRRHIFFWLETLPYTLSKTIAKGYGYPTWHNNSVIGTLRNMKVMQPTDLYISYYDIVAMDDAKDVLSFFENQNAEFSKLIK